MFDIYDVKRSMMFLGYLIILCSFLFGSDSLKYIQFNSFNEIGGSFVEDLTLNQEIFIGNDHRIVKLVESSNSFLKECDRH